MSTYTAPAFNRHTPGQVVASVRRTRHTGDNTYRIISRDGATRYDVKAIRNVDGEYIIVCPCKAGQNGLQCWHAKKVRRYLGIGKEDGSI